MGACPSKHLKSESLYPPYWLLGQGLRKHFTFGQAGFSGEGESVEMRTNHIC